MRSINLWAYHADFGALCRNAGLDNGSGLTYPGGNRQGQAGWHAAVRFRSLHDLATILSRGLPMPRQYCGRWFSDCDPIRRGEISRLAIMAHGDQGGKIAVDGKDHRPFLAADNVSGFHSDLNTVGLYTRDGSVILLMGCLAGQGSEGTRLLVALSREWPGRTVVGFSTVGYRHPGTMKRSGEACELPGMRDTDATAYIYVNPRRFDSLWSDFSRMPWASETSLHAKVVRDGAVERCPQDEVCTAPVAPPSSPARSSPATRR